MSVYDRTNLVCFLLLIAFSVLFGVINRRIWKEDWIPSLVWIILVDLAGLILAIYRIVIL